MRRGWILLGLVLLAAGVPGALAHDDTDVAGITRLAEGGDAEAQMKLGVLYASGIGIRMDQKEAFKWYQKSSDQGNALGQWNLAFMYVRGEAVAEDYAKARELFRKAADQGLPQAQYDLGMVHLQGVGVPPDRVEAEKWLQRAAAGGYRPARKMLKELEEN